MKKYIIILIIIFFLLFVLIKDNCFFRGNIYILFFQFLDETTTIQTISNFTNIEYAGGKFRQFTETKNEECFSLEISTDAIEDSNKRNPKNKNNYSNIFIIKIRLSIHMKHSTYFRNLYPETNTIFLEEDNYIDEDDFENVKKILKLEGDK